MTERSLDGPVCEHNVNLFDPRGCPKCEVEAALAVPRRLRLVAHTKVIEEAARAHIARVALPTPELMTEAFLNVQLAQAQARIKELEAANAKLHTAYVEACNRAEGTLRPNQEPPP